MLRGLYCAGKILCLATGNSLANVEGMLGENLSYFSFVGTSDSDGGFLTKDEMLAQIRKDYPSDSPIFVSDMDLDRQCARKNGFHFVPVPWGWELREGHKDVSSLRNYLLSL